MTEKTEMEIETEPKIILRQSLKEKLDWFSWYYEQEIGGFLTGEIKDGVIILDDVLIPHQEANGGMVNIDGKGQIALRKEFGDKCERILGEWHSHHSLGCFWSGDDEKVIEDFSKPRDTTLFIVSSKGEHLVRIEVTKPFKVSINKVNYFVEKDLNSELAKQLTELINTKVTKKEYETESFDWKKRDKEEKKRTKMEYIKKHKCIEIYNASEYIKDSLINAYDEHKPKVVTEQIGDMYTILFYMRSKKQAKRLAKELIDYIKEMEEKEDELEFDILDNDKDKDYFHDSKYKDREKYLDGYGGYYDGYGY